MTKVVMTNSFRGGTGKSTIISNLSSTLAAYGYKVIIIDADVISPGVHAMFGLDQNSFPNTLTEFLTGEIDIIDTVYDISENLDLEEETLMIVPSSIVQGDIAQYLQTKDRSNKLNKAITKLAKKFKPDFIMIDTHPGFNDELFAVSGRTDILFNIIRPDNQDYQGLKVSTELSKKLKLNLFVILNKVHENMNTNELVDELKKKYRVPVAGALPLSDDIILAQSRFVFSDKYPNHFYSEEIQKILLTVFGIKPMKHLEIMYNILKQLKRNSKVKQKKGISVLQKKHYIAEMVEKNYVQIYNEEIKLTDKGVKFLKKYSVIKKFVNDFRL